MMDIGYMPAPPPEEFEEPAEVPLPPGIASDWDQPSNGISPYGPPDNGSAWQRAMDALSQTQPSKPGFGPYGAGPAYPAPMPAQTWTQPSYGYAPQQYQQSYAPQPSNIYAGSQYNPGQGLGYAVRQAPYGGPAHQPGPVLPTPQHHQTQSHESSQSYSMSPMQSSTAAASFSAPTPQNSLARQRPPRPRYSPYAYNPSSLYGQNAAQSSHYQSGPPPDAAATTTFSSDPADMDIDEADSTSVGGYSHSIPQKQAPGAGGIRFQLSKKNAEVTKPPNPLLQRRPGLLPSPSAAATASNGNSAETSSTPSSSASSELLSGIQSKDWPVTLQEYVTKAIRITPADKHERVMHTITQMITTAYKTNTLYSAKWESAPMPYANESSNELFGLSPQRENESSSPASFRSRLAGGRGGGPGARNSENVRRGRVSGRRSSESEDDEADSLYGSSSRFSPNKPFTSKQTSSAASSRWDENDKKSASPEVEFMSLHAKGSGSTGKKGKLLRQAVGKHATSTPTGLRGKLMSFGTEAPQSAEDLAKLRKRQERFSGAASDSPTGSGVRPLNRPKKASSKSPARVNGLAGARRALSTIRTVVGTCQVVEKEYFRLTEAVEASQVRPVEILVQALSLVKEKWKREKNYPYTESQMKSIRQDLRVQHVFSEFTVQVYETHARIALEVGDQAEFTQCLSQLEWLYDTLRAAGGGDAVVGCENRREFLSYRILYVMRQNRTTDVTRVRTQLSEADKRDTCIAFAFSVLSAYFAGDYQQFFSLYKIAPLMSGYVMEVSIPQFRQRIFVKICTAYRPNLPVTALKEILRFPNEAELRDFLKAYKLTYTWLNGAEEIDCKASLAVVKAGPEAVDSAAPTKPQPVSARPTSKTRRKFKA